MEHFYRALLWLYPPSFRREFADEMALVFADCSSDAARCGWRSQLAFTAREVAGVVRGALEEHLAAAVGCPPITRRLNMTIARPRFRFPISAIAFMSASLALVLVAIRDARVISDAFSRHIALHGSHASYDNGLMVTFGSFWLLFAVAVACALITLAIMHALHRSGTHRLADAQTWPQQK